MKMGSALYPAGAAPVVDAALAAEAARASAKTAVLQRSFGRRVLLRTVNYCGHRTIRVKGVKKSYRSKENATHPLTDYPRWCSLTKSGESCHALALHLGIVENKTPPSPLRRLVWVFFHIQTFLCHGNELAVPSGAENSAISLHPFAATHAFFSMRIGRLSTGLASGR